MSLDNNALKPALTGPLPASPVREHWVKGSFQKMVYFLSGKPRAEARGGFTGRRERTLCCGSRTQALAVLALAITVLFVGASVHVPAAEGLTSYIDGQNRFVLDGKPFFPLGLFVVQSLTDTTQLDEIADSPFDTVMNYNINNGTDREIRNHLDHLWTRNLRLVFSLKDYVGKDPSGLRTIEHKVNTFKDHPAIIAWYVNDELDPEHLPALEAAYQKVKGLDRNRPVWSVHWNTDWLVAEAHTTDIVGVDPYPVDNNPITLVSAMADAANRSGKPLWLVPQIFNWRDYPSDFRAATGRQPTKAEMRAMTYLAINHGARGLIYYSYFNIRDDADYKTRWKEIKEVAAEVDRLRPVLLSADRTGANDMACNSAGIDFKLMKEGDTYYLFAVNTKKESVAGTLFRSSPANQPAKIDLLFESGRQVAVDNGSFKDDFGPYQVHVYHWKLPQQ